MTVPFLNASVDALISNLTLDEKILLLSGPNWWNTNRIERLEIPSVRMSDGPNGVRGSSHFKSSPAQCIPVRDYLHCRRATMMVTTHLSVCYISGSDI